MLGKQNDAIRGMLDRNKPITSKGESLISNSDLGAVIGGTPKLQRKAPHGRGNSQARVIEKEMVLAPQKGNPIIQMKSSMGFGSTGLPPGKKGGKVPATPPKPQVRGRSSNLSRTTGPVNPVVQRAPSPDSSSSASDIEEGAAAKYDPKNWMKNFVPKKGEKVQEPIESDDDPKDSFLSTFLHKAEGQIKLQE